MYFLLSFAVNLKLPKKEISLKTTEKTACEDRRKGRMPHDSDGGAVRWDNSETPKSDDARASLVAEGPSPC